MCFERLASNMERNIGAFRALEELAKILVQIRWWHINGPRCSSPPLLAEFLDNGDVAPDREAVVLEVLRDEDGDATLLVPDPPRAAGVIVRLEPRSCSTVMTFGACFEGLCGRAGMRSAPRS